MRPKNMHAETCKACQREYAMSTSDGICPQCHALVDVQRRATHFLEWQGNKTPNQADVDRIAGWMITLDARR